MLRGPHEKNTTVEISSNFWRLVRRSGIVGDSWRQETWFGTPQIVPFPVGWDSNKL